MRQIVSLMTIRATWRPFRFDRLGCLRIANILAEPLAATMHAIQQAFFDEPVAFSTSGRHIRRIQRRSLVGRVVNAVGSMTVGTTGRDPKTRLE